MCRPVYAGVVVRCGTKAMPVIKAVFRLKALPSLIALSALCAACTHLPDVGGKPLPKLNAEAPTTYRSLTDIPDAPAVTSANVNEAAIGALSNERGSTEQDRKS